MVGWWIRAELNGFKGGGQCLMQFLLELLKERKNRVFICWNIGTTSGKFQDIILLAAWFVVHDHYVSS